SVQGLAAKPIIDVDIVIKDDEQLPLVIRLLEGARYAYEGDLGVPGRYAFRPPNDLPRHHPYVCSKDNLELMRHVAFRNFLRENPTEAEAYAVLKIDLARRYGADRDGYSVAKTEFVERILQQADVNSGWRS
ncbi:MAG TPA: GrpB family protein, partial [Caulobacteraceae bacterium]